jgi:hypothetical protein
MARAWISYSENINMNLGVRLSRLLATARVTGVNSETAIIGAGQLTVASADAG